MTTLLELRGVTKRFPGVVALNDVSFAVEAGEVRALIGENGAGKSTLLKILAGQHLPDAGAVLIDGVAQRFASPRDSQAAGVAIIHQELQLFPELSVAENLMLGALPQRGGFVDRGALRARAIDILARLGEPVDPATRLGDLSIAHRQMIEIGRALLRDARILAFDEPTSSLSARETDRLMAIIGDLKASGCAIIYVSHRMEEVFARADSATVLRDGAHVLEVAAVTPAEGDRLVAAMAGRQISDVYGYRARAIGAPALSVSGLRGPGLRRPVDLTLAKGEIVGLFGLIGAGRSELFRLIFGAATATGGTVRVGERILPPGDPRAAIETGLALCPEDRKDEGIVPLASVRENLALAWRNRKAASPALRPVEERRRVDELIGHIRIKAVDAEVPIATLSGGNQQKAILARWLMAGTGILLLDEPTRGIDVGARSEIYDHIYTFAQNGGAVLFASSDMPEVLGVADRIMVMREGAVAGVLSREEATPDRLLRLALPEATPSIEERISA